MDDEADVKKIIDVINSTKQEVDDFQYEEFIGCDDSDEDITFIGNPSSLGDDFFSTASTFQDKYNWHNVSILKPDEKALVDSCEDPELKTLLVLNRTKNIQLIHLYKKIKDMLFECRQNIIEQKQLVTENEKDSKNQYPQTSGAWRLGAPYFKDLKLYGCPLNEDAICKINNKELTVYDLIPLPKWQAQECAALLRAVKLNYNINKQTDLKKQLIALNSSLESENVKDAKYTELTEKLNELKDNENSEVPPLNSDKYINWVRISEYFFKSKRSEAECRAFWHLYVHPSINRGSWEKVENEKLKEIAKKYKLQQWDKIVKELGTHRSVLTVCTHYFTTLHNKYKKGEFSYAEDKKIIDLVNFYKMGNYIPWAKISTHFKNRTRMQIHHRFTVYLSQQDTKKGKFTDAEDLLLMICVDKFGRNFRKCQEYNSQRSQVQLKSRYNTNLQHSLKKGCFTLEEDKLIMKHVAEKGTRLWAPIGKELGRSRGQIRQRFLVMHYFLKKNSGKGIDDVPRRKHNLKVEEEKFNILRSIADEFKDKPIPTLKQVEKVLKNKMVIETSASEDIEDEDFEMNDSSDVDEIMENDFQKPSSSKNIDDQLTEYFKKTNQVPKFQSISSETIENAANVVEKLLNIFQVDLDVPPNFDKDFDLDNIDVSILNILITRRQGRASASPLERANTIQEYISPNINTVMGLRSLLNKYLKSSCMQLNYFLKTTPSRPLLNRTMSSHLLDLDPDVREHIEADRNTFYRRFHSLFKWPSIMTMVSPTIEIQNAAKTFTERQIQPAQVRRTYSRKTPATDNVDTKEQIKKVKLTECPIVNTPNILKLTPVTNKSILENLLKDKTKKLFALDNVQIKGQTKTVIREIKIPLTGGNSKCKIINKFTGKQGGTDKECSSVEKIVNNHIENEDTSDATNNVTGLGILKTLLEQQKVAKTDQSTVSDFKCDTFIKQEKID